jgi:hypothetical protein
MQPEWPGLEELKRRGLIRVTLGSWHTRAVFGFMTKVLTQLRQEADFSLLKQFAISTAALDKAVNGARHQ